MAVINSPYVGNARGKLGDAVLYRSKGNTIARAYNPEPKNRRTVSQQSQRSVFSAAVKFYARGVQNLFLFAFENKKPQESDYNAFMRYNANRGMYFGPAQNDDDTYPALGDFVLTRGSLGTFNTRLAPSGPVIDFQLSELASTPTTLGELSQALVTAGLMDGDILTFLGITTDSGTGSPSAPVEVGSEVPNWGLKQFTVDLASTDLLTSLGIVVAYAAPPGILSVSIDYFGSYDEGIASGAVVVSRQEGGLLRVSNSTLLLNDASQEALVYGRGLTWRSIVLSAWNSEQRSILQGGISSNYVPDDGTLKVAYLFQTPVAQSAASGIALVTSQVLSLQQFASMLRMITTNDDTATLTVEGNGVVVSIDTDDFGTWLQSDNNPQRWVYNASAGGGPTWRTIILN